MLLRSLMRCGVRVIGFTRYSLTDQVDRRGTARRR